LAKEGKLFPFIKDLGKSRFSHAQFAVTTVHASLMESPVWKMHLFTFMSENLDLIKEAGESGTEAVARFVFGTFQAVIQQADDVKAARPCSWVLDFKVFTLLLSALDVAVRKNKLHVIPPLAECLSAFCTKCSQMNLFTGQGSASSSPLVGNASGPSSGPGDLVDPVSGIKYIEVTPDHAQVLISAIKDLGPMATYPALCSARGNLVECLTCVLRRDSAYIAHRKELPKMLLGWCREETSAAFSAAAWKLFRECFYYHSGTVEDFADAKLLLSFLDFQGLPPLAQLGALREVGGVFGLIAHEQKRLDSGLSLERADGRSCEKEIKAFIAFFRDKHAFIKLSMLHGALRGDRNSAVFRELAIVYYTMEKTPECARLVSAIRKDRHYADGFDSLIQCFK